MQTVQKPVREVTARKVVDGIYRDVVQPYGVQRRDYLACCKFSNEIEKQLGIKSSAISTLENGARGFRLKMTSDSGAEYEVMLTDGTVKLGLIREHQPRLLLAQGSASSEATWAGFSAILQEKEGSK